MPHQLLAGGERRRGIRIDAAGEDLEQAHAYGYFDRRKPSAVKAGFLATARVIIGLLDEDCRDASSLPWWRSRLRTNARKFSR